MHGDRGNTRQRHRMTARRCFVLSSMIGYRLHFPGTRATRLFAGRRRGAWGRSGGVGRRGMAVGDETGRTAERFAAFGAHPAYSRAGARSDLRVVALNLDGPAYGQAFASFGGEAGGTHQNRARSRRHRPRRAADRDRAGRACSCPREPLATVACCGRADHVTVANLAPDRPSGRDRSRTFRRSGTQRC